jgi:predicted nucleic acid-binding protein
MIVLDTNVISESLRPQCAAAVTAWLDAQHADSLFVTTINMAELWAGVAMLAKGARRTRLESSLDQLLARLFEDRCLDFDRPAARAYATITRKTVPSGKSLPLADGLIGAIAISRGFAVATRDVAPFVAAGVAVMNPWEYRG